MDILTIILPIQEHRVSFHFFESSSISCISVLQFSEYRSFTSLVKIIPRYFILFDAILNRIVFLLSFSDSSWLVYRKATGLYILILYPATLLNSFITSNSLFVETLGLYICSLMIPANSEFYFFPSNLDTFSFFLLSDCCG